MEQIKILDECFRRLFYDLGERNWNVIKPESWDKYVNNNTPFNEAQLKDLQDHYNDLLSELAEEQDEIWEEFYQEVRFGYNAIGTLSDGLFMDLKEDYIIIRKPKEIEQETKKESSKEEIQK